MTCLLEDQTAWPSDIPEITQVKDVWTIEEPVPNFENTAICATTNGGFGLFWEKKNGNITDYCNAFFGGKNYKEFPIFYTRVPIYGGYNARFVNPQYLKNIEVKGDDGNFAAVHITRNDNAKIKMLIAVENIPAIQEWWNNELKNLEWTEV